VGAVNRDCGIDNYLILVIACLVFAGKFEVTYSMKKRNNKFVDLCDKNN